VDDEVLAPGLEHVADTVHRVVHTVVIHPAERSRVATRATSPRLGAVADIPEVGDG
jgi:hypothetical protein